MRTTVWLSICLSLGLAMAGAQSAEACQFSRVFSPLEFLAEPTVLSVEIVARTGGGQIARVKFVIAGDHDGNDFVLPGTDCVPLKVGQRGYLGIGPRGITTMPYHFADRPREVAHVAFYEAFARATTHRARAQLIATHVARGQRADVDFPDIAVYLTQAPEVIQAMTRREAVRTLRRLKRHPRVTIPEALAERAK